MAALTVGVTTARFEECKRGLAVNLAASLARRDDSTSVCVVDADPMAHDVSTRLPVGGPVLEDFAEAPANRPPVGRLGRLHVPELAVLPCSSVTIGPRLRRACDGAVPVLRDAFDVVVLDLPGGPSGPGCAVGGRLDALDWLILAVTPDPSAVAATVHFLEMFDTARSRGAVNYKLRLGIVVTGDEGSVELSVDEVGELLGTSVVGAVPQLWGRTRPNLGFGAALEIPALDEAVAELLEVLVA